MTDDITASAKATLERLATAERHCECRPLDLARDTHGHDCDTAVLEDLRREIITAAERHARAWLAVMGALEDLGVWFTETQVVAIRAAIDGRLEGK